MLHVHESQISIYSSYQIIHVRMFFFFLQVLDVNYKWDEQYKLLLAASTKDINDLKRQIEILQSTDNYRRYGQFTEATTMEKKVCKII